MENQSNVVEEVKTEGGAVETQEVNEVVKEEKTFTQAELDKILNKKFAQWQKKTEEAKAEAEKLAEERKEFEAMKKQFEYEQRVNSTSKVLASNNLPIEFADFLIAENDEATTQRVDLFKNAFNEALEKALVERLKGNTPKTSTVQTKTFTVNDIKNMSAEEINKNWEQIKNIKF